MEARSNAWRNVLIVLALWEIAGRFHLIAGGALPSLSAIAVKLWADRADYPNHVWATLQASGLGFVIGNLVAVALGMGFVLMPRLMRLARGVNIALFALPPIVIAPILALVLDSMTARVTLAAIGVYFVTMSATVVGLTQYDQRSADVVRAYGGGRFSVLRLVQVRGAVPAILSGFRIAAPNAVLGAILAEFGGGGRWGLGAYLLGSLGRADPPRLWGIGLVATAIAGASYAVFAILSARLLGSSRAISLNPAPPGVQTAREAWPLQAVMALSALTLPFAIWWAVVKLLGAPEMIAKTPGDVFFYLFLSDASPMARDKLAAALAQTLPITSLGLIFGIAFAFLLAIGGRLQPGLTRALLPVALVTQTMPLVALTPLLVLMLGRGTALTLWVTISVTFFPAYVLLAQGLAQVPRSAMELPRAYGASAWRELRLVSIPASMPWLFAATRLTVPRALLGVMIAEWLATGQGLGNLLNQSRGYLDFGMIWSVATVSVLLSVAFNQSVIVVERWVLARMGMQQTA
jgi:ABC-type nitrate/sulfonate/bicarbonate transport system permease component